MRWRVLVAAVLVVAPAVLAAVAGVRGDYGEDLPGGGMGAVMWLVIIGMFAVPAAWVAGAVMFMDARVSLGRQLFLIVLATPAASLALTLVAFGIGAAVGQRIGG